MSGIDIREQVREAVDIVDLIQSHIALERRGRMFVAQCPWHDDRRPSLQVNPDRQSWKCWVCDIGGDIFSFVMQREGVEFREALAMLAERAGIPLTQQGPRNQAAVSEKQLLFRVMAWAEDQFHRCLLNAPEAEPARRYLDDRGITEVSIRKFKLGFSPNQWQWLSDRARSTEFNEQALEAAGLISRGDTGRIYDRFRGRALFSIRDTQDRPIAFGGRVLPGISDDSPAKYVNSPETRLFSKSNQLYALNIARDAITKAKPRSVVVVEGYTDVIAAHQHGVNNVVACLGTALGTGHVKLLQRFADTVILVLDGDEAGQRRAGEVLEQFVANQVDLRIVTLPDGLDPCDYLDQRGASAFEQLLGEAVDALEHKVRIATSGIDLRRETHRANAALEEILTTLARAPQAKADSASKDWLRQQQLLARLSRLFGISDDQIRTRLAVLRRANSERRDRHEIATPTQIQHSTRNLDPYDRELFELMLRFPEVVSAASEAVSPEDLRSDTAHTLWNCINEIFKMGELPEFSRVVTSIDDPSLKSLVVELDESAAKKEWESALGHLDQLVQDYHRRADEESLREQTIKLETNDLSAEEELQILADVVAQKRRQGGFTPTDG